MLSKVGWNCKGISKRHGVQRITIAENKPIVRSSRLIAHSMKKLSLGPWVIGSVKTGER
jgi:hypothetical protein